MLTELAQNAVDAAATAGVPACLRIERDHNTIRVANAGAPLNRSGVEALASLRASGKSSADGQTGRYGVGFTAVLTVAEAIEVRSRTGSVRFDIAETAEAIRRQGVSTEALDRHGLPLPVLRLPFASSARPADGWDTEIVLELRSDLEADPGIAAVLDGLAADAPDVMLDLAGLMELTITEPHLVLTRTVDRRDDGIILSTIRNGDAGERRWWVLSSPAGHGRGAVSRPSVRWLWPEVDGGPGRAEPDVLRAPTRSDEPLTLPALVVADLPLQPDRRRLMPTVDVAELADGYADIVARLPAARRTVAIPDPGLPAGPVDAALRTAIDRQLRTQAWIDDTERRRISGSAAVVLSDLDAGEADVIADMIPGLVHPEMSARADASLLRTIGARILTVADVVEAVAGAARPPHWWRQFYDILDARVIDALDRDNCGALPVPLADGRLVTGPRTVVIADGVDAAVGVDWVRVVHPDAVHPLLTTLGAREARPADLLADPALQERIIAVDEAVADHPDDPETVDEARRLADTVVALAASIDGVPESSATSGLGAVLLDEVDGFLRPADELVLPDAPLREILADDAPVGVVADRWIETFGASALRRIGVGWDLTVVVDDAPTGPEHLLDDEESWWDGSAAEPDRLVAVRDLDLIAPDRWVRAIDMILAQPETAVALDDPAGYTCWWLRRHARVAGLSPALYTADDGPFVGILDRWPGRRVPTGLTAGDRIDDDRQAAEVLRRLADPGRVVSAEATARAHRLLGAAVAAGRVDPARIDPPERVRTSTGDAVDADGAYVLDLPWYAAVVAPEATVVGSPTTARELADLLDLDIASAALDARVVGVGTPRDPADDPRWIIAAAAAETILPVGKVIVHSELLVRVPSQSEREIRIAYWVDDDGLHVDEIFGPSAILAVAELLPDI